MSNSKPVVGGKKHISQKSEGPSLNVPDFFSNRLQVAKEVLDDIKSKGLEHRWVNAVELAANDGHHRRGWQVYKKPEGLQSTQGFVLGNSHDGTIRRKELVLAVRPKEWGDAHRADIRQRQRRLNQFKEASASELRSMAQNGRLGTSIVDDSSDESA